MLNIVDSGNNYAFEVHQYLDSDSSGSTTNIVSQNIGVTRISGFTQWLKTNSFVIFGLMNEPNALPASQWVSAANAAIEGIRGTGATNLILVPGVSWTGAHSWVSSGNSVAMLNIVD
jgi:aryl-phospho-beta-D-glucosidase BglC (GH1 family)